jgi:hypothetical protein
MSSGATELRFVEIARSDRANDRGAFHEFVAGAREEASFWKCTHPVAGSSDALQGNRNRRGEPDLADEIDIAEVDPQLERRRGDHHARLACL